MERTKKNKKGSRWEMMPFRWRPCKHILLKSGCFLLSSVPRSHHLQAIRSLPFYQRLEEANTTPIYRFPKPNVSICQVTRERSLSPLGTEPSRDHSSKQRELHTEQEHPQLPCLLVRVRLITGSLSNSHTD